MKKSDVDIIKQWIEYTGTESAPEGFSKKVMSRIELERAYTYANPINKKFVIGTILVFTALIILAITVPSAGEYHWIKSVIEKIAGFVPEIPDSLSIPDILPVARYIFFVSIGIISFIMIDRLLAKFLIQRKRYTF
ncbi:MAG: hypothetical protein JW965_06260 [Bacteroidales bacterium]|nr:hypothetical protein [Bacteroidales bacterium]